ncbi:MAG: 3-deoxy-manno-octulosonate cytidylyltransferase [Flavobacteriales bacterium]|jgi:3-deoxy-manno-octulosonate cytidylyltransferase (CMP-KDO synthetase)|nr:3-deoxy-manno-octulosonate cytidylyltransferase [Flavobacteriales bacterium]MBK6550072.1 3-deoxy-manno-octulosonate cytidylyltransferase [Flavobacteriales bacterium]MBK6881764.1 3-deoxy-manno-octulosonate cytidylyltransferase [Flavobacteriales bacterium]MBK7102583.1 3-deoxy-manno-octulosonate cytidylyltransferase [Flavobacteriales bacterium]MBK7113316.1 3-deoxy-manno-octulosonate cytidylyltransferase [Flavobacteriales bacterium]
MRILGIIPARYASTRLPGKPLADIAGKSMVQRVLERATQAGSLTEVVVATDDARIFDHVGSLGGRAVMTGPKHPSGTDRCFEALRIMGMDRFDAVVNIQGDEPFLVPAQIDELTAALARSSGGIATLAHDLTDDRDLDDPGKVKITTDVHGDALYFSRAAIPALRDHTDGPRHGAFRFLKHIGLYAYRSDVLEQLVALEPSTLERAEALEQLRWLEHGFKVRVGITTHPSFCVDTPADLEEARRLAARS